MPDIDPRVLLFGTCYISSQDRADLTRKWADLMLRLNADCDIWLIDSASPIWPILDPRVKVFNFGDNIGHLSRAKVTPGKDGWGRAFCYGLQMAVNRQYDYAVHIEGDSLFRRPVMQICRDMRAAKTKVASIPVLSGDRVLADWVETGLMFFDASYVRDSGFIRKYDWPNRRAVPTPEKIIRAILGKDLTMMPWRGMRQDKVRLSSSEKMIENNYDWITHFHNDAWAYDRFIETVA